MAAATNVLITGSNRGVGKGLLSVFLSRPNHNVIAGLRDPDSGSSEALHDLPRGKDSRVILVKIDSASETDAFAAVQTLASEHNITKLDVVIANAGISNYFGKAAETPVAEMLEHFKINAVAPLLLFQATLPLLKAGTQAKFVTISSGAGSIGGMEKLRVENTAYGTSKAALNFITRKIHSENPDVIAFPINPGWLQTELGNHAAAGANMPQAPTPLQVGVDGVIDQIDKATKEYTSGKFMTYDGQQLDW